MERIVYARYCLLVFAAFLVAGCSHKTNPPAGQIAPPPPINIVGAWSGKMGVIPITYVFNADGTESVITQTPNDVMATRGNYTLNGDQLAIHASTMQAMGRTARVDSNLTQTIVLSGDQLALKGQGLVLTRLASDAAIPQVSTSVPGAQVGTMANGQQYVQGPTTVTQYPSGAPPASIPPAGPHTIAPPAAPSTQISVSGSTGAPGQTQAGSSPGGAVH